MTRLRWILSEMSSRLWASASVYGGVAVITALAAIYLKKFIPADLPQKIGSDAVDSILNILAASMLSVTIFSLSTMVSAYGAATNNVTPRATKLLIEDKVSHRALSTFLGAFIFSMVGIIALKTGAYGDTGRLILYVVTIGVIVMIIISLLRWIEYLARLGRVNETIDRVEKATLQALETRLSSPYLGGSPLLRDVKPSATHIPVPAESVGYVQYVDVAHLSGIAEKYGLKIFLIALPGKFIDTTFPLVVVKGTKDEEVLTSIRKGFIIGNERSFKQDPRFGMVVLNEIASRALSPATNDSGTAIYMIGAVVRVLSLWAKREELAGKDYEVLYPNVYVPPLKIRDLFEDFFAPVSRDGASIIEVQIRLQKAYEALGRLGDADLGKIAIEYSSRSLKYAEKAISLSEDKEKLRRIVKKIQSVIKKN